MAALAPMPSASVSTTVTASPLVRASERTATLRSLTNDIILLFFPGSQSPKRQKQPLSLHPFCVILAKLLLKRGMQLAIHGTDQSKLFPVTVLLQYARLSYASQVVRFWDVLSRFGQPASCKLPGMCSVNSGLRLNRPLSG